MTPIEIRLAHSPDSDDMVMWWPLTGMRGPDGQPLHGADGCPAVETAPFRFTTRADDVEALNRSALAGHDVFDASAISAAAYPRLADRWVITSCGGSFGEGYGPKLVVPQHALAAVRGERNHAQGERNHARRDRDDAQADAAIVPRLPPGARLAIPGRNTTAFLALSLALGTEALATMRVSEVPFADIPGMVARGEADAGLLIHEAQLMFGSLRLAAALDLGAWWTAHTGLPLPLGLNVIRRDLDARHGDGTCRALARVLSASVRHAREHPAASRRFLRLHAADRDEWRDDALLDRYLAMYVSDLTEDMGERGRRALAELYRRGTAAGLVPPCQPDVIEPRPAGAETA